MVSFIYGVLSFVAIAGVSCWVSACIMRVEYEIAKSKGVGRIGKNRIRGIIWKEIKRGFTVAFFGMWLSLEYLMKCNHPDHILGSMLLNLNIARIIELPMTIVSGIFMRVIYGSRILHLHGNGGENSCTSKIGLQNLLIRLTSWKCASSPI